MNIYLLLSLLFSPSDSLLKQGESVVPLADLDSYVYLLPPEKRTGFINDKIQIEKNIITLLNINIVYDYIIKSDIESHELFSNIEDVINNKEIDLDDEFYLKLGIEKQVAYENVKHFIKKQEYYARMLKYLEYELMNGAINDLAKEYFLINSQKWSIAEKRDLSIIQINQEKLNQPEVEQILLNLLKDPTKEQFETIALEYSDDPTVKMNKGHLSKFRSKDLNYPFVDKIFSAEAGVIPTIFKYDGKYLLIRVNEIVAAKEAKYEDHEEKIKLTLIDGMVSTQFQNIINTQANSKLEINPEVMTHVFERYKILAED
jgi:hypothetical protein